MVTEREKALDLAIGQIEKQFGKGSIMKLGEASTRMFVDHIPTGAISLDLALGVGGIPRGRVTEIFGPEMAGKSTLALHIIAEAQRCAGTAAFIDVEHAIDPGYAAIYTYARSADEEIPALEEGQQLALDGRPWLVDKETQPPPRLSEAKLVQLMEEQGLGTKATRPDIIQKLYSRKYVRNHPPEPTATTIIGTSALRPKKRARWRCP